MIKLTFDKELDKETFTNFIDFKVAGVDFGKAITNVYPDITKENHEHFIDEYYKMNKKDLDESLEELKSEISKSEAGFFDVIETIFGEDFRSNDFNGALSIFDCNPRYLEDGIFQFYYKKDLLDKIEVVMHETLHFIFFDYCDRNLGDLVSGLDKNSGPYWALSEIFNVIILNKSEFQIIMKRPELMFYPDLREVFSEVESIWEANNGDIRKFVEMGLKVLGLSLKDES